MKELKHVENLTLILNNPDYCIGVYYDKSIDKYLLTTTIQEKIFILKKYESAKAAATFVHYIKSLDQLTDGEFIHV